MCNTYARLPSPLVYEGEEWRFSVFLIILNFYNVTEYFKFFKAHEWLLRWSLSLSGTLSKRRDRTFLPLAPPPIIRGRRYSRRTGVNGRLGRCFFVGNPSPIRAVNNRSTAVRLVRRTRERSKERVRRRVCMRTCVVDGRSDYCGCNFQFLNLIIWA